jgi:hypothetical protein
MSVKTTARMYTQRASPNAWEQSTPMSAPPRCPPNSARGGAAGARVRPREHRGTTDRGKKKGDEDTSTNQRAMPMPVALHCTPNQTPEVSGVELDTSTAPSLGLQGAVKALLGINS